MGLYDVSEEGNFKLMFKPHHGYCCCCGKPGIIATKNGLRQICNESSKKVKKEKKKETNKLLRKTLQKQLTLPKLIKQLDAVFSLYIRYKYADNKGNVRCYTSGKMYTVKTIQCGHFISRRHYATRWDIINCKPQSVSENIYNQGNGPTFAKNLIAEYGPDIIDKLEAKKNNKMNLSVFTLSLLVKEYQEKLEKLPQWQNTQ